MTVFLVAGIFGVEVLGAGECLAVAAGCLAGLVADVARGVNFAFSLDFGECGLLLADEAIKDEYLKYNKNKKTQIQRCRINVNSYKNKDGEDKYYSNDMVIWMLFIDTRWLLGQDVSNKSIQ